jgi:hypothetical protein
VTEDARAEEIESLLREALCRPEADNNGPDSYDVALTAYEHADLLAVAAEARAPLEPIWLHDR